MSISVALLVTVYVDVVAPAKGLVTGQGWYGTVLRDPAGKPFVVRTGCGEVIGPAKSYRDGATRLAVHYGHPRPGVKVDIEHEHRETLFL